MNELSGKPFKQTKHNKIVHDVGNPVSLGSGPQQQFISIHISNTTFQNEWNRAPPPRRSQCIHAVFTRGRRRRRGRKIKKII